MALTKLQERFCDEYLLDLNATQAAIRAGIEFKASGFEAYVYFLLDELDRIIYVGKGRGRRMHQHLKDAKAGRSISPKKYAGIVAMIERGHEPKPVVICDGMSDKAALMVERSFIFRLDYESLLNSSLGTTTSDERCLHEVKALISSSLSADVWKQVHGSTHPYAEYVDMYWASLKSLHKTFAWRVALSKVGVQ